MLQFTNGLSLQCKISIISKHSWFKDDGKSYIYRSEIRVVPKLFPGELQRERERKGASDGRMERGKRKRGRGKAGKEGKRESGKEEKMEGGREGRKGGRKEGREGRREGGREGWKELSGIKAWLLTWALKFPISQRF